MKDPIYGDVSCGPATASELQRIALRPSNSCFTRHWLHFNHPARDPHLMAISCIDHEGNPARLEEREMERRGFAKRTDPDGLVVWLIRRVDEDGSPFESLL
jgi:hypothetical protein